MSTYYIVERWRDVKKEMRPILYQHWQEIALNHAEVPLDIDDEKYDELDESGAMHVLTVRNDGRLIGYHIAIITTHLHYKSTLHGITDVYYILPEFRGGKIGLKMFQAVEKDLKRLGVRKLFTATKLHLDQGRLFEFMGYKAVERLYAKLI